MCESAEDPNNSVSQAPAQPQSKAPPQAEPGREVLVGKFKDDPCNLPAVRRLGARLGEYVGIGFPGSDERSW